MRRRRPSGLDSMERFWRGALPGFDVKRWWLEDVGRVRAVAVRAKDGKEMVFEYDMFAKELRRVE